MSYSVIVSNATKKYKMYKNNSEKLLDLIHPIGIGENFYAVQNISFTAEKGDVIGIVGVNGAGKSTLANLIAGVIPPTMGEIEVRGEVSLIAIASGLNVNLTGRENIELKCLMLGFDKEQIEELMPSIIEFADIGKFIDQPVKSYSSGMKSRLGFAISVNIDPDVLVIDEALSVGDPTFADKCLDKMNEFKKKGKTIFFISHSIGQIKKFCQKVLWLEAGEIRAYGTTEEILPQYEKFIKEFKQMSKEEQKNFKQLILEKRSKLRGHAEDIEVTEKHTNKSKLKKGKGRFFKIPILIIGLITILIFLWQSKSEYFTFLGKSTNNDSTVQETDESVERDNNYDEILTFSQVMNYVSNLPEDIQQLFKSAYVNKEQLKIILVGSPSLGSTENGWSLKFKEEMESKYGEELVDVKIMEFDGTSTEFINDSLSLEVAEEKADLIIFEGFTLKDNSGLVDSEKSLENIQQFLDMLKSNNPDIEIIVQPPNPIHAAVNYPKQVDELKNFVENTDMIYFNHWENWPDPNSEDILNYINDQSLPNELGHKLWADSILKLFIADEGY